MTFLLQADTEEVKRFVYARVLNHPRFSTVIAVSVDKYPGELLITIWIGQEPDPEMRQFGDQLEAELRNLGVACSIVIKTDRQLPFGGIYPLRTQRGEFTYRLYRLDPLKDEDLVYVIALYQGADTYRFRLSLSGTLASMLRARNRLDENRIEEVYLDWIKEKIDKGLVPSGGLADFMFDSRHISRFAESE